MSDDEWTGDERRAGNGRKGGPLERHVQTIALALALAGMLWVGNTLIELSKEQVRTTEQTAQLRALVNGLQEQLTRALSDRYTAGEARRELATIELRLQDHDKRIERVERRK